MRLRGEVIAGSRRERVLAVGARSRPREAATIADPA